MIHEALAVKLELFFVIDACAYHDLISGSLKFQNLICNFTNGFIACINFYGIKHLIHTNPSDASVNDIGSAESASDIG